MISFNLLVGICLAYVASLFLVAFLAERRAARGLGGWLRSPLVYTLSLSVYCTAWTFYGAVGYAARSGLEFVTIYLGPTIVLVGWWLVLLVIFAVLQRRGMAVDTYQAIWGSDPSYPGNKRRPIGWGVRKLPD